MVIFIVFLLGLCLGSFLNVCIYRLPISKSIIKPRSFCPQCETILKWFDNIPLISYVLLKGKCRYCKTRISFRYFIVEFLTAGLLSFIYIYFVSWKLFFSYSILACGLIIATFTDIEHRIIPDEVNMGLLITGFMVSFIFPELHRVSGHWQSLFYSFIGAVAGAGSIFLLGLLGKFLFRKESMGGGDVKLFAMVGAFLGWKLTILAFFISPFFCSIFGITRKILYKDEYIPYGPFLALGSMVSLFWGEEILRLLLLGVY